MLTDARGRLRSSWAFVFSSLLTIGAFLTAGALANLLAGDHVLRFEACFRVLLAGLLLGAFSWLLTVANHVEGHRFAAQGLPAGPGSAAQFLVGCGMGCVLVLVAVVPIAALGRISVRSTWSHHSVGRLAAVVVTLLAGALAEELMFRGYPFQRLTEAVGPAGAIAIFSVLFGAVHLANPGANLWGLINTVAIGVLLARAYLRTRALWLPWGIHAGWNAMLGLVLGLPVSGVRLFNVVLHSESSGPNWLTGGSYGIEAAATGTCAAIAGFFLLSRLRLQVLGAPLPLSPAENQPPETPTDIRD